MRLDDNTRYPGYDDNTRYPGYDDNTRYPGYDDSTRYPGYDDSTRYPGYDDSTRYPGYDDSTRYPWDSSAIQGTQPLQKSQDIISEEALNMFRLINFVILCSLIGLFGIIANVINMIVFYRQGFNTTTNISFFALAISDTLCLVSTEWFDICMNPYLKIADISFVPEEVQYLSGGLLHVCFCRITSWITVFITAERFMGVTLPLKVKQIITLEWTAISMCVIFVVNIGFLLPEYSAAYLDWKFVPARNRSLFGLVYRSYKDEVSGLVFILTSASGIISFVCVILLTSFLVYSLKRTSEWRTKATGGSDNSDSRSSRDKKTMKMIIMIATVLIVCYIPGTAVSLVTAFVPEFSVSQTWTNSYFTCWSIAAVFDTINSSVNVFLYYRMSTKYRHTFNELFNGFSTTHLRAEQ